MFLPYLFDSYIFIWLQIMGDSEFQVIQGEVRKVLSKGKAPGVLRLVFHDAGTFESNKDIGTCFD